MTSALNLKERILKEMKDKRAFEKSPEEINASCDRAFEGLSKINFNRSQAEKQLKYLRGK